MNVAGRRTTPDSSIDKDEGISDDMDDLSLSELRLQLELNEQVPSTTSITIHHILHPQQSTDQLFSLAVVFVVVWITTTITIITIHYY